MSEIRIINKEQAAELLSTEVCIPLMRETFASLSADESEMLPRISIRHDNGNIFALMAASLKKRGVCGSKVIMFPGPVAAKTGTSGGVIPLFDTESGALLALVDGAYITVTRTAAASAAATDALARRDAASVAILGCGNQGIAHAKAICMVRKIETVYLWSPTAVSAERTAETLRADPALRVEICRSAEEAVRQADVVCTTSKAREPILFGEWLKPGAHVNCVGCCAPMTREIDGSVLRVGRVFVDSVTASPKSCGDILIAAKNGEFDPETITGELGAVLNGTLTGRENDQQITVFETIGISVQDVAAADAVYRAACERGVGTCVAY